MVATPVSAVISDKLGRRKCMFVGAWIIIIGSIIIASGTTLAQFVVGRFILGVGIQVMVVSAPAYAVEIAPPHWRGRAVGQYLTNFIVIGDTKQILMISQVSTTAVGSEAAFPPL